MGHNGVILSILITCGELQPSMSQEWMLNQITVTRMPFRYMSQRLKSQGYMSQCTDIAHMLHMHTDVHTQVTRNSCHIMFGWTHVRDIRTDVTRISLSQSVWMNTPHTWRPGRHHRSTWLRDSSPAHTRHHNTETHTLEHIHVSTVQSKTNIQVTECAKSTYRRQWVPPNHNNLQQSTSLTQTPRIYYMKLTWPHTNSVAHNHQVHHLSQENIATETHTVSQVPENVCNFLVVHRDLWISAADNTEYERSLRSGYVKRHFTCLQ